jgi:hypothetical protein
MFCDIIHLSTLFSGTLYWIPVTAFFVGTIVSPKFQAIKSKDGEKLFMKWVFMKGVKEIG